MLLEVRGVTKEFGGLTAVSNLSFEAKKGEILGLIGPNGAGKTTVFNLITGVIRPSSGKIFFNNIDITRLRPHKVAEHGIGRTFQANVNIGSFSVLQNILVGCHLNSKTSFLSAVLDTESYKKKQDNAVKKAEELLAKFKLDALKGESAENLSHGHQRCLYIAVALAADPELLLLDEPISGMNTSEIEDIMKIFVRLRDEGLTIVLVEHHIQAVMEFCDRIIVLDSGVKIAEGNAEYISKDAKVIKAYLGE
jgi:branched-chain amino acid transport system ATP-binding protein